MATPVKVTRTDLVVSGDEECFAIQIHNNIFIDMVTCLRIDGPPGEFELDLFSRGTICRGSQESENGQELPEELFKVTPTYTSVDGKIEKFASPPISFVNEDSPDPLRAAFGRYMIYVRIRPVVVGANRYALAIKGSYIN